MHRRYLILGVSAASLGVLNKLRALDPNGIITCLAAQEEPPFNMCLIADVLAGTKKPTDALTKDASFFKANGIEFIGGEKVIELDPTINTVLTESGNAYEYDVLFIGTGTTPTMPEVFLNLAAKNVFTFQSLQTTQTIIEYCEKNEVKTATVVGGGLTGIECADALNQRGIAVTLVERGPHLMAHALTAEGGTLLESLIREQKVTVVANSSVAALSFTQDKITDVVLDSGEDIKTDLIVCATGARPNSDFALGAGLKSYKNRIVVDSHLRTSDPSIFAAGDVAAPPHLLTKKPTPSMAWPDAMMQGMHAAHAMAGVEKPYAGIMPLISSRFFGTGFVSAGTLTQEAGDKTVFSHGPTHYHFFVVTAEKHLKGFMMVGNLDHIGKYRTALIKQEIVEESFFSTF